MNYYTSAGIITLLTLQDTTKETMVAAYKKFGTFFLSVLISYVLFNFLSFTTLSFGIYLFIFVVTCYYIKMYEAIPINAVLATHFLMEGNMSFPVISNEAFLMVIGTGIGIFLNLYMPSNVKYIRKEQSIIEKDFKNILNGLSAQMKGEHNESYLEGCLASLDIHISKGIKQAYDNMNNTFFKENRYFIDYMELRCRQYKLLQEIHLKVKTLNLVTPQGKKVATFIEEVSNCLSESQKAGGLLELLEELLVEFKESSLPVTREEFENRAVLYMILMDVKVLIKMKESFAESLSKEQIDLYWRD